MKWLPLDEGQLPLLVAFEEGVLEDWDVLVADVLFEVVHVHLFSAD